VTTRKRAAKKAPAKQQQNSNISQVQKESAAKQQARIAAEQAKREQGKQAPAQPLGPDGKPVPKLSAGNPSLTDPKQKAAQDSVSSRNSNTLTKSTLQQNAKPGSDAAENTFRAGQQAASKIAGLTSGIMDDRQAAAAKPNPLADASNYGANPAQRAARLSALSAAQADANAKQLKGKGNAVWMGSTRKTVKLRNTGPERMNEGGGDTSTAQVSLSDDVKSTDELMSWLTDEKTFNQIRDAAKKSGIDVQSYDDVAKLWQSVVSQAAAAYSTTGKKVTPWALLQLRGKSMVNGKPAAKTTTSTNIDEMDPAQAKVMIKQSLQQMLGRDPRQDEIDDFVAKAQTIAQQNPQVTKTTTQYDFAGTPTDQTSVSHGGADVVNAKAQLAAEQSAENAPDYAQYQAAGVYAPWMFQALASPI